jgi:hypothetical protein
MGEQSQDGVSETQGSHRKRWWDSPKHASTNLKEEYKRRKDGA